MGSLMRKRTASAIISAVIVFGERVLRPSAGYMIGMTSSTMRCRLSRLSDMTRLGGCPAIYCKKISTFTSISRVCG